MTRVLSSLPCIWWGSELTKWFGIKQPCDAGGFWQHSLPWGWHVQSAGAWFHMLAMPLVYQSPSPRTLMSGQLGASLYRWWVSCFPWKSSPSGSSSPVEGHSRVTRSLLLLEGWSYCGCQNSLKETMIWTWLADCLSLDSLAPLSLGQKKKNIPGSIHVYNCNEVRVSRCIPLKGLTQCSRKPFEVNKLFTFSKGDRNRKSSIVLSEIRMWDRPFSSREEVAVCVTQNTCTVDLCFYQGH